MNIGERDQLQAAFRDLAGACWDYFQKLKEQGFNEQQAIVLVASWQTATIHGGRQGL